MAESPGLLEEGAQERVLILVEDGFPDRIIEILWICSVDRSDVPDHAIDEDRDFGDLLLPDKLLNKYHDLLGPSRTQSGYKDLAATFDGLNYDL